MTLEPRFLDDAWRREAIVARLRALEQEDYQHAINERIAADLLATQNGASAREAAEMARTAAEARAILAVTHATLVGELEGLGEVSAVRDPPEDPLERRDVPLPEVRGGEPTAGA